MDSLSVWCLRMRLLTTPLLAIKLALATLADAAAVRAYLKNPTETFPDAVVAAILDGVHPVRAVRDHRGMTQAALAKAAGTSAVYLSQIERGRRRAGRKLRARLAKTLRVEPDLLRRGD